MKVLRLLVLFSVVLFFVSVGFVYYNLMPTSTSVEEVVVEVVPGPFSTTIQKLVDLDLIKNRKFFILFSDLTGYDSKIKTGEYSLRKNMWAHEILEVLTSGKSIQRSFTIPEGANIFNIAEILEEKNIVKKDIFLAYVRSPKVVAEKIGLESSSLEGYLFPETYNYTKTMGFEKIVDMMVQKARVVINRNIKENHDTRKVHRLITFASIVEKETGVPEERPIISSVFHNRIKLGMKLQTDPTVIYGMALEQGVVPKNIRKKDLSRQDKYNTYFIRGLPPGPIANPGEKAIQAVLNPEKTDFLYFVSMNEGRHYFSKTLKEHNEAVKKYQLNRASREGKSWRNLKKQN